MERLQVHGRLGLAQLALKNPIREPLHVWL